ncbi:MAG TPA: hypothetical protein P5246_08455 [Candidatus Omnitrophota bacterium]|nr:hypothetical protein [Candidatus Omnitrophota bacterium]HSA30401.1 hypothetical protein [Candidatus Omnitrophota bacterium]
MNRPNKIPLISVVVAVLPAIHLVMIHGMLFLLRGHGISAELWKKLFLIGWPVLPIFALLGFGVFKLNPTARKTTIAVCIYTGCSMIVKGFRGKFLAIETLRSSFGSFSPIILALAVLPFFVLNISIAYYLMKPSVRALFEKG